LSENALEVEGVQFAYPNAPQLFNDLTLTVQSGGEIKCLLGPSGVGKSTLLVLALEEMPHEVGRISTSGSLLPILQNYEGMLLPWFSALRNITWGANSESVAAVQEVSRFLEIKPYLKALPRRLSAGQRQRIVLARALVRRPDLLLLDEPLANLDAGTLRRVLPHIKQYLKESRSSALWITHNIAEALAVADTICVLHEGGVVHEFPIPDESAAQMVLPELNRLLA
jgi:ABC-type nitrate/sulfonate/bicarbonate transport system ATPase subunit